MYVATFQLLQLIIVSRQSPCGYSDTCVNLKWTDFIQSLKFFNWALSVQIFWVHSYESEILTNTFADQVGKTSFQI